MREAPDPSGAAAQETLSMREAPDPSRAAAACGAGDPARCGRLVNERVLEGGCVDCGGV